MLDGSCRHHAFNDAALTRIDVVDPTGNGTALGAVVGVAVSGAVYLWEAAAARSQPEGSVDQAVSGRRDPQAQVALVPRVSHDQAAVLIAVRW